MENTASKLSPKTQAEMEGIITTYLQKVLDVNDPWHDVAQLVGSDENGLYTMISIVLKDQICFEIFVNAKEHPVSVSLGKEV